MDNLNVKNSLVDVILDESSIHSNKEYLNLVNKYQLLITKYNNVIKTSSNVFTRMQLQLEHLKRQGIFIRVPSSEFVPVYESLKCEEIFSKNQKNKDTNLLKVDIPSERYN